MLMHREPCVPSVSAPQVLCILGLGAVQRKPQSLGPSGPGTDSTSWGHPSPAASQRPSHSHIAAAASGQSAGLPSGRQDSGLQLPAAIATCRLTP